MSLKVAALRAKGYVFETDDLGCVYPSGPAPLDDDDIDAVELFFALQTPDAGATRH